ncbi:MAG TPA: alternative ribosome rescue aminoacyl-tRNA hydrolase ArfB [Ignavibacteriaceae bacterium]|nr:alternative ribosome rescue aminoacyl-tRNA hydrolase ArfB [Ignavibacteriaceae bacterium]
MIEINNKIFIPETELHFNFIRSSGPGGQNVNKVSTAVQLRFDIINSPSLPEQLKKRLIAVSGNRATKEGILIIEAKRFRTQESNKQDALKRFIELIRKAEKKPKRRIKTKPSKESRQKRIEEKKKRSEVKKMRRINYE